MLIVNKHASYISTKFIQFTRKHKGIYLYLLTDSTYLLQLLNIGVFGSLKQDYKMLLAKKTSFKIYNIDKVDFISLI